MDYIQLKQELEVKYNEHSISEKELCQLTNVYIELEDYEKAFALLEEGIANTHSSYLLNNLGYYYLTIGEYIEDRWFYRPDKAADVLKKAVALNPENVNAYALLGIASIEQGNWDDAAEALMQAARLKKDYIICNNLGVTLFHQHEYLQAADYFWQAHKLAKKDCSNPTYYAYFNYCLATIYMGDIEKGQSEIIPLESYILNEETDEVDEIDLARLYYLMLDYEKVIYWFENTSVPYKLGLTDFSIYSYALKRTGREDDFNRVVAETLADEQEALDDLNPAAKEQIERLTAEIEAYQKMSDDLKQGLKPVLEVTPYMENGCYLFECVVHQHS